MFSPFYYKSYYFTANYFPKYPNWAVAYPISQMPTTRFGIPSGTHGRGGITPAPIAFVLHQLGVPLDNQYDSEIKVPLDRALINGGHPSVHYAVRTTGDVHQYVATLDTAWAIWRTHNVQWTLPAQAPYVGVLPDYYTINIATESFGLTEDQLASVADIIARDAALYDIPVDADHVVGHAVLDDAFGQCFALPNTDLDAIIAAAQAIGEAGGIEFAPDFRALRADVDAALLGWNSILDSYFAQRAQQAALQAASDAQADDVAALTLRATTLESEAASLLTTQAAYNTHAALAASASALGHVKAGTSLKVAAGGVLDVDSRAASYARDPLAVAQSVPPNSLIRVDPEVATFDPHTAVAAGPLWGATPIAGNYFLSAYVLFDTVQWAAAKNVRLYLYDADTLLATLDEKVTALFTGRLALHGALGVVSNGANAYNVRVLHDDTALPTPTKQIVFSSITLERV